MYIVFKLLKSWTDEKIINFASAVAACACLTIPHTLNTPELNSIYKFIKKNNY